MRRLITAATNVVQSAYRQDRRVVEVIDEAERTILEIRDEASQRGVISVETLVWDAVRKIEVLTRNSGKISGVSTGFRDFDQINQGRHVVYCRRSPVHWKCAPIVSRHLTVCNPRP